MIIRFKHIMRVSLGLMLAAAVLFGLGYIPSFKSWIENAAYVSAGLFHPEGFFGSGEEKNLPAGNQQKNIPESSVEDATDLFEPEQRMASADSETLPEAPISENAAKPPEGTEKGGNILERHFIAADTNISFENVVVRNTTKTHTPNIKEALEAPMDLEIKADGKPYVLVLHTHSSESYMEYNVGWYPKGFYPRTTDRTKNIIRVGDEIVKKLETAGIGVIHDTNLYDDPMYNGAYDRAGAAIDKHLKENPSIQVVLDIHRDAIQYDDGTKVKPTAVIDGKKAAQIMILSGCQEGAMSGFPDWKYNLRFSIKLQKSLEEQFPGLCRPLLFCPRKYNMFKTHNSLLIEMGSDANTLEEAVYSGEMLGKALTEVLAACRK